MGQDIYKSCAFPHLSSRSVPGRSKKSRFCHLDKANVSIRGTGGQGHSRTRGSRPDTSLTGGGCPGTSLTPLGQPLSMERDRLNEGAKESSSSWRSGAVEGAGLHQVDRVLRLHLERALLRVHHPRFHLDSSGWEVYFGPLLLGMSLGQSVWSVPSCSAHAQSQVAQRPAEGIGRRRGERPAARAACAADAARGRITARSRPRRRAWPRRRGGASRPRIRGHRPRGNTSRSSAPVAAG